MKKILMFGMTSGYGGIESFIMNVFRNLDNSKYIFNFVKSEDKIAYEDELRSHDVKIYKITPRNVDMKQHYKDMENIFKQEHFDIVWTNRCMLNSIAELKYAKKYNCPIRIMHAHSSKNTGSKITQFMHDFNKRRLDTYCTLKFSCSKEASSYFFQDKADVVAINNGLDVEKYLYDESIDKAMRVSMSLEDAFLIGHVGRFTFEKNQKFAIDAFQKVKEEIPSAKLLLCGKGPLFDECVDYVNTLGLKEDVLFLGEVQNIPQILQCLNIFIFPSLFEGLPYAALEAQFTGTKCFISKYVSPEVIISKDSELLDIASSEEWAKKIIEYRGFQKKRHEEFLRSPFNITETCKQIENMISL